MRLKGLILKTILIIIFVLPLLCVSEISAHNPSPPTPQVKLVEADQNTKTTGEEFANDITSEDETTKTMEKMGKKLDKEVQKGYEKAQEAYESNEKINYWVNYLYHFLIGFWNLLEYVFWIITVVVNQFTEFNLLRTGGKVALQSEIIEPDVQKIFDIVAQHGEKIVDQTGYSAKQVSSAAAILAKTKIVTYFEKMNVRFQTRGPTHEEAAEKIVSNQGEFPVGLKVGRYGRIYNEEVSTPAMWTALSQVTGKLNDSFDVETIKKQFSGKLSDEQINLVMETLRQTSDYKSARDKLSTNFDNLQQIKDIISTLYQDVQGESRNNPEKLARKSTQIQQKIIADIKKELLMMLNQRYGKITSD